MIANLHDVLALVGPLDDRTNPGTPRGRLHQFIDEHGVDARSIGGFLSQCQERLGRQHARARQDLIVKLGESLGFDPDYGTYDPAHGRLHLVGQWRSPGTLLLLDVRSERTQRDDAEDLARAIDVVSSYVAAGAVRVEGLVVITPFYVSRRQLEQWLVQRQRRDIRCVSVESLVWLAEMRSAARLSHDEIERLLTTGPDADFMIALVRLLTADTAPLPEPLSTPARPLRYETRTDSARAWVAMLFHDELATPRQLLDSVIRRRQVLEVSRFGEPANEGASEGMESAPVDETEKPKPGERIFFYIAGEGLVGHATIDALPSDVPALLQRPHRFAAVCRLRDVDIYDLPRFVDPGCPAGRLIYGALDGGAGAVVHSLDEADAAALRSVGSRRTRTSVS